MSACLAAPPQRLTATKHQRSCFWASPPPSWGLSAELSRPSAYDPENTRSTYSQRELVDLGAGDLDVSTERRYAIILSIFTLALWVMIRSSLLQLLMENEGQTITVCGTLFLQLGYDSGLFGLSDAGSFISALKRLLDAAPIRLPGYT